MKREKLLGLGTVALMISLAFSPLAGEAQAQNAPLQPLSSSSSAPALPVGDVLNLVGQITTKLVEGGQAVQQFVSGATGVSQNVTAQSAQPNSGYNLSGLVSLWNTVNNWFTQNVGVSLADVVKTVVNFMIYIWTIIIKLLEALVAHL